MLQTLGREDVAGAADGPNDARVVRIGLDLAPDARDPHVDSAVEGVRVASVGEIEQALAGEHPAGMIGEGLEEVELRSGERVVDAVVVLEHARLEVEPLRAEPDLLAGPPAGAAATWLARRMTERIRATSSRSSAGFAR